MATKLNFASYSIVDLKGMSKAEKVKEYNRLRKSINSKAERLLDSKEFVRSEKIVEYFKNPLPSVSTMKGKMLEYNLNRAARLANDPYMSVKDLQGIRKKSLETLHAHDYKFVNVKNWSEFGNFMKWAMAYDKGRMYDSGDTAEIYGTAQKLKIPPEQLKKDFEWWRKNYADVQKLDIEPGTRMTQSKLKQRLAKKKKVTL